ncbi:MAG: ABC transporter ATP-binding protein [Candidatus Pacebacteria bacterium]|nr:ABC transporter ATP-binding protein [Candidatus Paceibacterota bacterium]
MNEGYAKNPKLSPKSTLRQTEEMKQTRDDLMKAKKEHLAHIKDICLEIFGTEQVPQEFVQEMLDVRKHIVEQVGKAEYLDDIEIFLRQQITQLALKIANYKNPNNEGTATIDDDGEIRVVTAENRLRLLSGNEEALLSSLELYFDTFRMAQNSARFKKNVEAAEQDVVAENAGRRLNFYSEKDKKKVVAEKLQEKYSSAGFTDQEILELVNICKLEDLDKLEVHDIKILVKIGSIFKKFMHGDKTKYTALSAGLLVPAFINGYAPQFIAKAVEGGGTELITQIGLYALLTAGAAGISINVEKNFTEFLDKNFSKERGIGQTIATNLAEFPADQMATFGADRIKDNIAKAREGYEDVFRLISFDILPACVTLATSAAVLFNKSPTLAGATVLGAGVMIALDEYIEKTTGWQSKTRLAREQRKKVAKQISEQLAAHLEVVLSGMKEELSTHMSTLLTKERQAISDRDYIGKIRDNVAELTGSLNYIIAGITSFLVGASPDMFVASLLYSGNFQQSIAKMISSKALLIEAFTEIQEMDLMFNGYAEEEREKEKGRVGMREIKSSNIDLENVEITFEGKTILEIPKLHIPQGSMVDLTGSSGAGKTTLMKVISGYYKPTAGEVRLGEVNMDKIKRSGEDSIYAAVSYLSQFPYILEDTVRKNVIFGLREEVNDSMVEGVLREVGLGERFKNINEPLKGGRGDMGTTSGGEASRIGVARVLLKIRNTNSKLVFLDEPTASIDEKTKDDIVEIIKKEKAARPDVTFIVISHDRDFVSKLNCNFRIQMEKGKVDTAL